MFGQSIYGQNTFGQPDLDDDLIPQPWIVQCPDVTGWILIRQHNTTVEKCVPGPTRDDGGIEFPPITPPPPE